MKGYVLEISVGGDRRLTEVEDAAVLPLLNRIVGGHIEIVPYFNHITHLGVRHRCVAFCNEEGKLKRLPMNREATRLWYEQVARHPMDLLVGGIAVVWGDREFMSEL